MNQTLQKFSNNNGILRERQPQSMLQIYKPLVSCQIYSVRRPHIGLLANIMHCTVDIKLEFDAN